MIRVFVFTIAVGTVTTALLGMLVVRAAKAADKRYTVGTDSRVRRFSRRWLDRKPSHNDGESILLERGCSWNRNGTFAIAGALFILNSGRIVWKSSRIGLPRSEWTIQLKDIESVEFIEGSSAQKSAAPFAAGYRRTCDLILTDGTSRIIFPAQLGEVLESLIVNTPKVGVEEALIRVVGEGAHSDGIK
jgi:hypothetical protein